MKNPIVRQRTNDVLKNALGVTILSALEDKQVVEIMVNPDGKIWIDRLGLGREDSGEILNLGSRETIIKLVADNVGDTVGRDKPYLAANLAIKGERFQAMYPPVVDAPAFTIRKRPEIIFTLAQYENENRITGDQVKLLRQAVIDKKNILIAGGTGSGKTTFANALLAEDAFAKDRVLMIEDMPELQCKAEDQIALLTKRTDPPVTMRDLVKATLRLRPDRIIVGEVRDGSAHDMLKAWNTGHPGGVATIHANSALEALDRVEDLVGEVCEMIPYRAIGSSIDVIIFMSRSVNGPIVKDIVSVEGYENGQYKTQIC